MEDTPTTDFVPAAPVPRTEKEEKKARSKSTPGPKPKRKLPWLKQYQFKPGQPCPFRSPGRPTKKVLEEKMLAELERTNQHGKSKLDILIERRVDASCGLLKVSPTELAAMDSLLMRFAGKGEAGKEEEKSKGNQVAILIGNNNTATEIPQLPEATEGEVIESEIPDE